MVGKSHAINSTFVEALDRRPFYPQFVVISRHTLEDTDGRHCVLMECARRLGVGPSALVKERHHRPNGKFRKAAQAFANTRLSGPVQNEICSSSQGPQEIGRRGVFGLELH